MKKRYLMTAAVLAAVTLSACAQEKQNTPDTIEESVTERKTDDSWTEELNGESENSDKEKNLSSDSEQGKSNDGLNGENGQEDKKESEKVDSSANTGDTADGFIADAIERVVAESGAKTEDARSYQVDDFDGDGQEEAFVFVGSEVDEAWQSCEGDIYFVTKDKCENLKNGSFYAYEEGTIRVFDTGSKKFIGFSDVYATAAPTNLYYVENGEPKESIVSGIGSFFIPDYIDGYCINLDSYDNIGHYENGEESFTGHTWKNYYFYYDEALGDFKEYVGHDITEDELNEACGMDLTGEIRSEGYEIDSMFKRDNGIYHVNYSKRTDNEDGSYDIEYGNATYNANAGEFIQVWEPDKKDWQSSDYGGTILKTITE